MNIAWLGSKTVSKKRERKKGKRPKETLSEDIQMSSKQLKWDSTSLVIKEIQTKTTMK
jgi:hypothetical protein